MKFGTWTPSAREMVVSKNAKLFKRSGSIFLHIPKTAGVSVFKSVYGVDSLGHVPLIEYERYLGKESLDALYKFTFVRNPFTRLNSAYTYLAAGGRGRKSDLENQLKVNKYKDFEAFVHGILEDSDLQQIEHLIPQYEWLIDSENRIRLDLVCKMENLAENFRMVEKAIKVKSPLRHLNKSTSSKDVKLEEIYTSEMVDVVRTIYKRDLVEFNYDSY